MASTYTTNIRIEQQGDGDNKNSWGTVLNNMLQLVDEAITAYTTISLSSVDVTLTAVNGGSDQSRSPFLELTGALTADVNIIVPSVSKSYIVKDKTTGSSAITIKTVAGAGSSVADGTQTMFICDGVSVSPLTDPSLELDSNGDLQPTA